MQKLFFAFIALSMLSFKGHDKIRPSDFSLLEGNWSGTLTYLNYKSDKKNTIPCDLIVTQSENDKRVWYFKKLYPKEPHANTIDTITISRNGKKINTKQLAEKSASVTGVTMVFREKHNDDGVDKDFRFTYSITKNLFSIKKEESTANGTFIERNRYEWQRK